MKKICFIYPRILAYILPLLRCMADGCELDYVYSPVSNQLGYGEQQPFSHLNVHWTELKTIQPFGQSFGMYQIGILNHIIHTRPDAVLIWVNPRYISFWAVLFLCKVMGIEVYPRGHGLIRKEHPSALQNTMQRTIIKLCTKYLCYTQSVKDSLIALAQDKNKLVVDNNTQYNDFPVIPSEKTGTEKGILFIGRLRPRCGIELLMEAIRKLRVQNNSEIELHIIGDGQLSDYVRSQLPGNPWIKYHGKIYEDQKISLISRECRFGCHPEFAGLSVVQMMSLSLPSLTHGDMYQQGPEPSYIKDKINGRLYLPKGDLQSLSDSLQELWNLPFQQMRSMQKAAYETFQWLSTPPFHIRMLKNLGCINNPDGFEEL